MVYYGPNANLFGGFKNDYWQYKELKDISEPLTKLFYFLLVDIFRVSLNALILWKYCKISLLWESVFCYSLRFVSSACLNFLHVYI